MRVAVTGGSGFIGSKFIELFADKFEGIKSLNSKSCPLDNYEKILEVTKDIDVLVHTAFDHSYKNNISGIRNILKACEQNGVKKLIHISTVSVYEPDAKGVLNENSPYSKLNDPYSKEKRKIEQEIEKYKNRAFDIIILQPTIVYGLGGNWTKYALHVCKAKEVRLPESGNKICNAIHVDDVANAIYLSCTSDVKFDKFLISGSEPITWKEFYSKHCQVLKELKLPSNCNIQNSSNENEFHKKKIVDIVFQLWFKTPIGNVLDMLVGILKKLRAKSYSSTNNKSDLKIFLQSEVNENILEPLAITNKVHNCNFSVDSQKAKEKLSYVGLVSFDVGMKKLRDEILGL
ncbi:NAD-dependent epimerase/dehydratase family protein [Aliarcobacter cibarius]|uniref:NAD-dependent epimerase/dehydratase family protein n=1 Tax=Aliarcobacter cibarius TaxID=255507 RepID=UPI0010FCDD3A|nr:NAD(P)-dependent oxidoreductase [Aliarcobacter cibarius]TLT05310.1 NAD(P)-dependent oxidoreductase [Aliarcobacter cibarius]